MIEDLLKAIRLFKEAGNQVVLMMDANEDVTCPEMVNALRYVGLVEAITTKHKDSGFVPTYQRGSVPVDGLWISPS